MEKELRILRSNREYKFYGNDLTQGTFIGKEAMHETLRNALRFIDQGYKVTASFSLEALYLKIRDELKKEISEEILLEQTQARKPEKMTGIYPIWTHYQFDPPTKWTPERIKSLRMRMKASRASFGKIVGVTGASVELWERGAVTPYHTIWRFFDMLNYDPWTPLKYGFMTLIPKEKRKIGGRKKADPEVIRQNELLQREEEIQGLVSSLQNLADD